jgi:hypothetical protein
MLNASLNINILACAKQINNAYKLAQQIIISQFRKLILSITDLHTLQTLHSLKEELQSIDNKLLFACFVILIVSIAMVISTINALTASRIIINGPKFHLTAYLTAIRVKLPTLEEKDNTSML